MGICEDLRTKDRLDLCRPRVVSELEPSQELNTSNPSLLPNSLTIPPTHHNASTPSPTSNQRQPTHDDRLIRRPLDIRTTHSRSFLPVVATPTFPLPFPTPPKRIQTRQTKNPIYMLFSPLSSSTGGFPTPPRHRVLVSGNSTPSTPSTLGFKIQCYLTRHRGPLGQRLKRRSRGRRRRRR